MKHLALLLACALLPATAGAQAMPPTGKPAVFEDGVNHQLSAGHWNGQLDFPGVYCLQFPEPDKAASLSTGLVSGGSVALAQVEYPPDLIVHIVASTMPAGRDGAEEHRLQLQRAQASAAASPDLIQVAVNESAMGPVIIQRYTNVALRGQGQAMFPLEKQFYDSDSTRTVAQSHLFARPADRFEVSALAVLGEQADAAGIALARQRVQQVAAELAGSLQQCTGQRPARMP